MAVIKRSHLILIAGLLLCLMVVVPVSAVTYVKMGVNLTSNNLPAGYNATGYPDEQYGAAYKAFDGDVGTYWEASTVTNSGVSISMPDSHVLLRYMLFGVGIDYPTEWKLYGSNDNSTWYQLDSQGGQSIGGWVTYNNATNIAAYSCYKIAISASGNAPYGILYEMQLFEDQRLPISKFTTNVTSGISPTVVKFTDITTNSGTTTGWSYGAKNATGNNTWFQFSTTQNPEASFGVGNWSVNLTATNAAGSDLSDQITWINVSAPYVPPRSTIQTITHDFGSEITYALVTLTEPGEVFSVSNLTSTTFDLTITNAVSGLAGTNQTVYWCVG